MRPAEFIEKVKREQPDQLMSLEIAAVSPRLWTTRHGSGRKARIRLPVGELKYERSQGEQVWRRVDEWTMGEPT